MESYFFSTFVILDFCEPTLGHVFRHVGTCHVGVLHIKWKVLKNWCVWPPRFWKSDQNWGTYGLDNENIQKTSLQTSSQLWLTPWLGCDMVTSGIFSLSRPCPITPSILVWFSKSWWPNTSVFQDLSFDVQNTHVERAHMPRNVS